MTDGKAHAQLGASNAERWRNCKRSPSFIEELRAAGTISESNANKYTAEGSVAHAWAERFLTWVDRPLDWDDSRGTLNYAPYGIGEIVKQDGFDIETTQEMLDAIDKYTNYIFHRYEYELKGQRKLSIEKALKINDDLWGTTDAEIYAPYWFLEVVDYKHGKGKFVPVKDNTQLLYYATAAYFELPENARKELSFVRTTICQPRHHLAPEDGIMFEDLDPLRLHDFRREILADAAQVSDEAALNPGSWCDWCPAAQHCPAALSNVHQATGVDITALTAYEARTQFESKKEAITTLTDDQRSLILENADTIRSFLDSVEEFELSQQQAGKGLPGWTLKTNWGNYRWVPGAEAVLVDTFGDIVYKPSELKSRSEISKLVALKPVNIEELATRKVSSQKLVREKDLKAGEKSPSVRAMLEAVK